MKRHVALLALCLAAVLCLPLGCKERDKPQNASSQQKALQAARADERARQAEVRADALARQLSERAAGTEGA